MKVKSLFVVSIICFFSIGVFAESGDAVTGLCKDGTSYTGASKKGACRGHKGVKEWYADKAEPAEETKTTKAETPAAAGGVATGLCKDGTEYIGASKKGACRGHKGVKEWYADKQAPAVKEDASAKADTPKAAKEDSTPAASASAAATGLCKDGTEYTGASKRGACRGHKGVKEWYADKQAPAAKDEKTTAAPASAPAEEETEAPAPPAKAAAPAPAARSGKVWVNTRSKIYHCEGTKYYGNTKEGEYMSEPDAQAKGFVANRKKVCNQ
jgi:hypothetical protein